MSRINSFRSSGERYPVLRLVGAISTFLGILLLGLGGLMLAFGIVAMFTDLIRVLNGLGLGVVVFWSFGLMFSGLQVLAMGAFCRLAIHVEENTRATAQALERLRASMEPKAEADPRSIFLS